MGYALVVSVLLMLALGPSGAETAASTTGADAFNRGCGGCHNSEDAVVRRIPRGDDATRRAWLQKFMALHPCECDEVKPEILDHLVQRSRR